MATLAASHTSDSSSPDYLDEEARVQLAVSTVSASGFNPQTRRFYLPITQAALQFGVSRFIIIRRLQGISDRHTAHQHQQSLSPSQEIILTEWAKSVARRSLPLTRITFRQKAESVVGHSLGDTWFRKFLERNPNVKLLWTTPLESCRAQALNRFTVSSYFDLLSEIIRKYNISPSNIYNMDEKGLQLGIGKRLHVLVDRNQKSVQKLENGNKELVTVVECICADGTALKPLFIMKGMRTSPSWTLDNPIQASIASSPNGWTDMELGSLWLEKLFEPQSKLRCSSEDDVRLLILDGHNSHYSLSFLGLAERFKIFILCLPPHTTHALQPCDVGVFGPLSTHYKMEVSATARQNIHISKQNVISVYGRAWQKAFTKETIQAAFRKCGIHPLNPSAVPDSAFEPALAMTTQPAQPIPTAAPGFINAVLTPIDASGDAENNKVGQLTTASNDVDSTVEPSARPSNHILNEITVTRQMQKFTLHLPDMPLSLSSTATRGEMYEHIISLERLLRQASDQIAADHAQKILMDDENGQLRTQLFQKKNKDGTRALTVSARLLTHEDSDLWNQIYQHKEKFKDMHEELGLKAAEFRKRREEKEKKEKEAKKKAERDAKFTQREVEAAEKATLKDAEAAEKAARKKANAQERVARKEAEAEEKAAKKAAEKAARAAKKEAETMAKAAKAAERAAGRKNLKPRKEVSSLDANKENLHIPTATDNVIIQASPVRRQPQPQPRPAYRGVLADACTSNQSLQTYAPVIDPQLLTSGEKRNRSIINGGMQEDDHIMKRPRTSLESDRN
ncbi:hypothetical protein ACEPAH_1692 [Sanghuangporus vaninii]